MASSNRSRQIFTNRILDSMDRSMFPSVMLYLETEDPNFRLPGMERDWSIFLQGVENGAHQSFDLMHVANDQLNDMFGSILVQLNDALALSDDMKLPAVEMLLKARNQLTDYANNAWKAFDSYTELWFSSVLALKADRLNNVDEKGVSDLAEVFIHLLRQGGMHPFFAWATETYDYHRELKIKDLRVAVQAYIDRGYNPRKVLKFLDQVGMQAAVGQYLKWANLEWQETKNRIKMKAMGLPVPTAEFSDWVSKELLDEDIDDDEGDTNS